jgi:hypothetical protein
VGKLLIFEKYCLTSSPINDNTSHRQNDPVEHCSKGQCSTKVATVDVQAVESSYTDRSSCIVSTHKLVYHVSASTCVWLLDSGSLRNCCDAYTSHPHPIQEHPGHPPTHKPSAALLYGRLTLMRLPSERFGRLCTSQGSRRFFRSRRRYRWTDHGGLTAHMDRPSCFEPFPCLRSGLQPNAPLPVTNLPRC